LKLLGFAKFDDSGAIIGTLVAALLRLAHTLLQLALVRALLPFTLASRVSPLLKPRTRRPSVSRERIDIIERIGN